jgi:hypothetical protein
MSQSAIRSSVRALLVLGLLTSASSAAVIHVPADFPTIQQAIDAASSGDQILVAPGTYFETIDFLGKGLQVIGEGGAGVTTIDAAFTGSVVTARSNEPAGTLIRGFTLLHGSGQTSATLPDPSQLTGGGVFADLPGTHLSVHSCTIAANVVPAGLWGAAGVEMRDAAVELLDCTISANSASGGAAVAALVAAPPPSRMVNCSVIGNTAGSGVRGLIAMEDCNVSGNTGHGYWLEASGVTGSPQLKDCVFADNGGFGVVVSSFFGATLRDCLFLGNGLGGASVSVVSDFIFSGLAVRNCVFVGDQLHTHLSATGFGSTSIFNCTFDGGSVDASGSGSEFFSSNVARNGTVFVQPLTIEFSDIQGGAPGTGNIDADPLWVNPAALDYRLEPGSPCINTGGGGSVPLDADGSPPDMGAIPYDPWTNLGGGVAGSSGPAVLQGVGSLLGGSTVSIVLSEAPPLKPVTLILGLSQLGVPFKGGTLWPSLDFVIPAATDSIGQLTVFGTWPAGVPFTFSFYAQVWYGDPTAPLHFAGSNGLRGTTP